MPEFVMEGRDHAARAESEFVLGYIEAAFFTAPRPYDSENGVGDPCPLCGAVLEEDESGAPCCNAWGCSWSCEEIPESYGYSDLAPAALERMRKDCESFVAANRAALETLAAGSFDLVQLGRDFWFTRNGHGVGYWDRRGRTEAESLALQALDESACAWGNCDLYRGDDGHVYVCPA